jgi:hypothetical protein
MLKFLLKDQLLILVLLPVLVLVYLIVNQQTQYFEVKSILNFGLWGSFPLKSIENYFTYISGIVVVLNAYLLNYLFNKNNFYEKNSYIIAVLYVVLLSYYHTFYVVDGLLISQSFIILTLFQLFNLDYSVDARKISFNVGFLIGIAVTLFPPILLIMPFLWFMITRVRPFIFREWLLSIFGLCVPLLYAILYNFIYFDTLEFQLIKATESYTQKEIIFLVSLILFSILLLNSIFGIRTKSRKSSIRFRKNMAMLTALLVLGIVLGVMDWLVFMQYEWFCFIVIPIALFLPFSYYNNRFKFISYLLFYITIIFSILKFYL